jgi:hypothetical protein
VYWPNGSVGTIDHARIVIDTRDYPGYGDQNVCSFWLGNGQWAALLDNAAANWIYETFGVLPNAANSQCQLTRSNRSKPKEGTRLPGT